MSAAPPPPGLLQQQQLLPEESLIPASPEEDAEDDQVQILVCGTSNEGTISDFVREHQLRLPAVPSPQQQQHATVAGSLAAPEDAAAAADAAAAGGGGGGGAAFVAATSTAEACIEDVLDFDERGLPFALAAAAAEPAQAEEGFGPRGGSAFGGGAAAAAAGGLQQQEQLGASSSSSTEAAAGAAPDLLADAAARGKVVMDWEVTRDRRWVYARDQSQWFNYGFDEVSFKDWVQRQLDTRLERLAHRAIFVPSVESSELQHPFVETYPAAEEHVSELRSATVEQANATTLYTPVQQLRRNGNHQHAKLAQRLPASLSYPANNA